MKLVIEGTYKHRMRINLIWFTIQGPWITDRFSNTYELPPVTKTLTFSLKNLPIRLDVSVADEQASVILNVIGQEVYRQEFSIIGKNLSVPFAAIPWKGCEVRGVAKLT